MGVTKKTMKEVIESDKQIIERLTLENDTLKEEVKNLKKQISEYQSQIEELNIKLNILTKNENNVESIDIKIKEALDKQNLDFNTRIENINKLHIDEINNLKLQYEKAGTSLPSPSTSSEIKKERKNKENKKDNKILLPDNILEVVYYRYINNHVPTYFLENKKTYLKCCNKKYKNKELFNNEITCILCYKTYSLLYSEEKDNYNNNYKFIKKILTEHIINNEKELLLKIKCNKCSFIYKKEIETCIKCKNINNCKIIEYISPNVNDEGYETKIAMAAKCFYNIEYISGVFDKAFKEGLVKSDFKELIEYIKENKIMEEKQKNIIKNKIIRCHDIYDIYNLDKYKNITSFIKRLDFSIKSISKLDESSFGVFKCEIIEKLDNELKRIDNNYENIIIKENNEDNINIENIKKMLNKNYVYKSNKKENLCNIEKCNNIRIKINDNLMDFCDVHKPDITGLDIDENIDFITDEEE